jgi:hypothetical protein
MDAGASGDTVSLEYDGAEFVYANVVAPTFSVEINKETLSASKEKGIVLLRMSTVYKNN